MKSTAKPADESAIHIVVEGINTGLINESNNVDCFSKYNCYHLKSALCNVLKLTIANKLYFSEEINVEINTEIKIERDDFDIKKLEDETSQEFKETKEKYENEVSSNIGFYNNKKKFILSREGYVCSSVSLYRTVN